MESERHSNWLLRLVDKGIGGGVMPAQQLLGLLFPLFLDQLFLRIISTLNTSMISSYGVEALSTVSLVDSLNNLMVNLFIGISTGCTVVVAQYFGRRDKKKAVLTAAQAMTSSVGAALVIMTVILLFTRPIANVLCGDGNALFQEYSALFLRASAISYPFFAMIQTGLGAMRGSGDTKTSVYFSTAFNLLNVLFNILFLNVFRFGVLGLSISLVASRAIVAIALLWYMLHSNDENPLRLKHFFNIIPAIQKSIMTVAIPVGLEQIFFHGGRTLVQMYIARLGMMSTAANAAALPFSAILQLLPNTLQMGLVTVAGQCIGAGLIDETKRYIKRFANAAVWTGVFTSVISAFLLPAFLGLYNLPPEAYRMAFIVCIITLVLTPFTWSVSFVYPNGLRAAGDARYTSMVALVCMWSVRVGGGYLIGIVLGYGLYGFWIAMFLEWAVRSVFFASRLRGDKWYRHRVIQD